MELYFGLDGLGELIDWQTRVNPQILKCGEYILGNILPTELLQCFQNGLDDLLIMNAQVLRIIAKYIENLIVFLRPKVFEPIL